MKFCQITRITDHKGICFYIPEFPKIDFIKVFLANIFCITPNWNESWFPFPINGSVCNNFLHTSTNCNHITGIGIYLVGQVIYEPVQ